MQALAIKYRPKTFDDVTEQQSIKVILQQQLEAQQIQHCYLFVGGAGTGKTTTARIFADAINKGEGSPIELDAASNNSVDDMRGLIQQAQTKSLNSEYKVFIVDECFYKDTPVSMADGTTKPISEICIGDVVCNMTGVGQVKNVFQNLISLDRLCIIKLTDGTQMLTTQDHLFFTNSGWVTAKDLSSEDMLYGTEMCKLWEDVRKQDIPQDVLRELSSDADIENRASNNEHRAWRTAKTTNFVKDADEQSNAQSRKHCQNGRNQDSERNITSAIQIENGKRKIHNTTVNAVSSIAGGLDIRIRHSYKNASGHWVPNVLQSRPCLSYEEDNDRGGWQCASLEKSVIRRCKENQFVKSVRVESVTLYQPGDNEQSFECYITDTERNAGFVTLYDLEVSENSSYFVYNTLVHNCHMITVQGWNAILKLIEEPPAKSIFIFCTTDPQKIPKTIISRVQRYDFQRISLDGIVNRLKYICDKEAIDMVGSVNTDALEYIAKIADGGMRDAITLLDKCIAYSVEVTLENVVKALGTVDYSVMIRLTERVLEADTKSIIEIIENIHNSGKDIKRFVKQYAHFLLDVQKYQTGCDWKYINIPNLGEYKIWLNSLTDAEFTWCRDLLDCVISLNSSIKYSDTAKLDVEAELLLFVKENA